MSVPSKLTLQSRVDQTSYQVYTEADKHFWFRLERGRDRDVITDYFLGSFPKERSGALLIQCYRILGLTPKDTLEFRDILSGQDPADAQMLNEAESLYATAGSALLAEFGATAVSQQADFSRGKYNLVLLATNI